MRKFMYWPAILIALVLLMCQVSSAMGLLKVGAVIPMTGEQALFGEIQKNALIMAVDDINTVSYTHLTLPTN